MADTGKPAASSEVAMAGGRRYVEEAERNMVGFGGIVGWVGRTGGHTGDIAVAIGHFAVGDGRLAVGHGLLAVGHGLLAVGSGYLVPGV